MRYSEPGLHREFWDLIRAGLLVEEASACLGLPASTGRHWFRRLGGVKPRVQSSVRVREPAYRRLSVGEREEILRGMERGESMRVIAARIGRAPSTVSRELGLHCPQQYSRRPGAPGRPRTMPWRYSPHRAQHRAERNRSRIGKGPVKLADNAALRDQVQDRLKLNHSPEQIARRLREDFPNQPEMWVSHETIYQALYVQSRGALNRELAKHLRTGRAVRKPHRHAGQRRERIPGMVSISQRPPEVADRAVPGHWEGDLILGSVASGSAIGTLVERTTRFVMLLHLPGNHTALAVQDAMIAKMAELPDLLRRTLTWDQGVEMTNHAQIAAATGLAIYFCDPHSPWQRGSNENTNGLLRQYFPKGTDLSVHGPGYLDYVAAELNNRPRKTLDWKTPAETLDRLLSNPTNPPGVALAT